MSDTAASDNNCTIVQPEPLSTCSAHSLVPLQVNQQPTNPVSLYHNPGHSTSYNELCTATMQQPSSVCTDPLMEATEPFQTQQADNDAKNDSIIVLSDSSFDTSTCTATDQSSTHPVSASTDGGVAEPQSSTLADNDATGQPTTEQSSTRHSLRRNARIAPRSRVNTRRSSSKHVVDCANNDLRVSKVENMSLQETVSE